MPEQTRRTMARQSDILPLSDLQVTADGLAPHLSGAAKGAYTLLMLTLAFLMLAAFAFYL